MIIQAKSQQVGGCNFNFGWWANDCETWYWRNPVRKEWAGHFIQAEVPGRAQLKAGSLIGGQMKHDASDAFNILQKNFGRVFRAFDDLFADADDQMHVQP